MTSITSAGIWRIVIPVVIFVSTFYMYQLIAFMGEIEPSKEATINQNPDLSLQEFAVSNHLAEGKANTEDEICASRWNYIGLKTHVGDVDYDIMMCFIPKNGCTVYKKIFRRLKGYKDWNNERVVHKIKTNGIYIPIQGNRKESQKCTRHQEKIDSYEKSLVILRNPYERLVSGYLDKMRSDSTETFSRCNFRRELFGKAISCTDHIPFEKFVSKLEWLLKNKRSINPHYDLQSRNCNLYNVQYQQVFDVTDDREKIYTYLQVPMDEAFASHNTSSHEVAKAIYKDPKMIQRVSKMFQEDLDFGKMHGFNYQPPQ